MSKLYNKKITVNGKKSGKMRLKTYLIKCVIEKKLKLDSVQTKNGFSDQIYFYFPEDSFENKSLFNLNTSNNWSTFVSDSYDETKMNQIKKILKIEISVF